MPEKKRTIIGVAAAEVNNIEQRQILSGIIAQAQRAQIDIAVISNIYNSNLEHDNNHCENEIYNLILSPDLDGLIFISESFVNQSLKEKLHQIFLQRQDLPVIAVGTALPELADLQLPCINTDSERDFEALTDHLIDAHGFTQIDLLTGTEGNEASMTRLQGYRNSLEKHGISYDPSRVHFGNFWMNAGEELAKQYITGSLPKPEAVVCANDYMAYGILDACLEHDWAIPEKMTVVGYEYIWERIYHSPLLTTYQRNRTALGETAVDMLLRRIQGAEMPAFTAPRGSLICGDTCPCRQHSAQYRIELKSAKSDKMYSDWNVTSSMDEELTACANVDDLVATMGRHSILVRSVQDIMLCLYEKWYDTEISEHTLISCRSVLPWMERRATLMHPYHFGEIFARNPQPAAYYFTPLFQGEHMFGHLVLKYDKPDTYDIMYKNWVKSVCYTLESIRMKNDIRYFRMYDTLSEQYDVATGLYHGAGFEQAVRYAAKQGGDEGGMLLLLQLLPPDDACEQLHVQVGIYGEVADCLRRLGGAQKGICGRLERNLFAFSLFGDLPDIGLLCDNLSLLLTYHSCCVKEWGMDAYVIAAQPVSGTEFHYGKTISALRMQLLQAEGRYAERRLQSHYGGFHACRRQLYLHVEEAHSVEQYCLQLGFSEGHFRKLYRDFFGISFHQEMTRARIAYAKFLLCTTVNDLHAVAMRCGFEDVKYFMRVFQKETGCTAKQYRQQFHQ